MINFLKNKLKLEYVLIGILIIVAICLAFTTLNKPKNLEKSDDYISQLEYKLEKALSNVKGVSDVKVVINVKTGNKTVYATETKQDTYNYGTTTTTTLLLVNGKPLEVGESYPEISGVLIVAKGVDKLAVKMDILTATTTLFQIDAEKVNILSA